jgi:hypothetical protein
MDIVGDFLTERCVRDSSVRVGASDLYKAFKEWCEVAGERCISQKALGTNLSERPGLSSKKSGGRIFWSGLRLREANEQFPEPKNDRNGEDGEDKGHFRYEQNKKKSHEGNTKTTPDRPDRPHESDLIAGFGDLGDFEETDDWGWQK